MKAIRYICPYLLLVAAFCPRGWTETLWTPGFDGYLTSKSAVQVGDIVFVQVDGSSSLSFQSASSDTKSVTLEFSGGEFGNLFSFLPTARSGGNQSVRGKQEYVLKSRFAARVTQLDPTGKARVEGTRGVSLEGKEETLVLAGWLDPADLRGGREVRFSQLADASLSFRTLLQPSTPTLTARDIQQIVEALAQPAGAAAPGAAAPAAQPPAAAVAAPGAAPYPAAPGSQTQTRYQLTDSKKLDLFLRYVNRLIDLMFQQ